MHTETSLSVAARPFATCARRLSLLDDAIDQAIDAQRIVGTEVVVLERGKLAYQRAAGMADREARRVMQPNALFRLASITKPIVSMATLRLVDQGRIDLDDAVTKYLPNFRPRLHDGRIPTITLRQLLTHTAGLSYAHFQPVDGPYFMHGVSDGLDQPGLSMEEELRRLQEAPLFYEPGARWGYSLGIDVLGAALEQALQKTLPQVVAELVTAPLGMVDTDFVVRDAARLVTPYADGLPPKPMAELEVVPFMGLAGVRFAPGRAFDAGSFASGGAGMVGTAHEVARALEAVRSGGAGWISERTARAMLSNQTGDLPIVFGPGYGFGFGGAVVLDPQLAKTPQSAGTWTWGGAYGHTWFVDPVRELVVVALTNTALEGMVGEFPAHVRAAVYGV